APCSTRNFASCQRLFVSARMSAVVPSVLSAGRRLFAAALAVTPAPALAGAAAFGFGFRASLTSAPSSRHHRTASTFPAPTARSATRGGGQPPPVPALGWAPASTSVLITPAWPSAAAHMIAV